VSRRAVFSPQFLEDLAWWVKTNRTTARRLWQLVEAVLKEPCSGIGKPEPLKYLEPNTGSRRIMRAHRLIYRLQEIQIEFLQGRYPYGE